MKYEDYPIHFKDFYEVPVEEYPCPKCHKILKGQAYACDNCKIQLVFYVKSV